MPSKLRQLIIDRVDMVDKGANPDAHFVLFKREGEPPAKPTLRERIAKWLGLGGEAPKTFEACLSSQKRQENWWQLQDALRAAVDSILSSDAENKALLVRNALVSYMEALMSMLDLGTTEPEDVALRKRDEVLKPVVEELDAIATDLEKAQAWTQEHATRVQAALTKLEEVSKAAANIQPDEGKRKGDTPMEKTTLEDVLKGLEPEQAQVVETALAEARKSAQPADKDPEPIDKSLLPEEVRKRMEDLEKQAKDATDIAKAAQERLEVAEFAKRAEAYPHIPGEPAEKADMLRKAFGVSAEFGEAFAKNWQTMNAQLASSELLKEAGRTGADDENSPEGKLSKIAKGLQEKDPSLSDAKALEKAIQANPELYT